MDIYASGFARDFITNRANIEQNLTQQAREKEEAAQKIQKPLEPRPIDQVNGDKLRRIDIYAWMLIFPIWIKQLPPLEAATRLQVGLPFALLSSSRIKTPPAAPLHGKISVYFRLSSANISIVAPLEENYITFCRYSYN